MGAMARQLTRADDDGVGRTGLGGLLGELNGDASGTAAGADHEGLVGEASVVEGLAGGHDTGLALSGGEVGGYVAVSGHTRDTCDCGMRSVKTDLVGSVFALAEFRCPERVRSTHPRRWYREGRFRRRPWRDE